MHGGPHAGKFGTVADLLDGFVQDITRNMTAASAQANAHSSLQQFLERLQLLKSEEGMPWTLQFRDPLANCYISALGGHDSRLVVEEYERPDIETERWVNGRTEA